MIFFCFQNKLSFFCIAFFLFLSSCQSPIYQNTTYGLDEFVGDSQQIAQGKFAILTLEEHESVCCPMEEGVQGDIILEADEILVVIHCPRRPDYMEAIEFICGNVGFAVCDGKVCLPHLSPIEVAGLSIHEGQDIIRRAYLEQIPDASVFVELKKRKERRVQVIGASVPFILVDGRMRLAEVLAKARLSPYANLFKSYVIRDGQQLCIDMYRLVHRGEESQNIVMQGGDQIFIANVKDASIMVMGEISDPRVIPVPYGFISLREAIAIAGGIPFTGNENCIQVIRGDLTRPKIYSLKWKEMIHYSNSILLLMPGDIVMISEKPITEWNRFISQLESSIGCGQATINIWR